MNIEGGPRPAEANRPEEKYSLTFEQVMEIAKKHEGKRLVIPIFRELDYSKYTPDSAYLNLTERGVAKETPSNFSPSFLLESASKGERGRYSYVGKSSNGGIVVRGNEVAELKSDGTISTRRDDRPINPLKEIQDDVTETSAEVPESPDFTGGEIVMIGFEAMESMEDRVFKAKRKSTKDPDVLGIPDAIISDFNTIIAFDHLEKKLKVMGNVHVKDLGSLEEQYRDTISGIDKLAEELENPTKPQNKGPIQRQRVRGIAQSNFTEEEYMAAVEKAKEYIVAGDIIQVVPSQRWKRPTSVNPFRLYQTLRKVNPSPFMFFYNAGDFQLVGASPELLVEVKGEDLITRPLAGTRPRGKTPEEDERLAEELRSDPKEKAEHIMLVDLGRNDVGRVSKPGSVEVTDLMGIERYSHVMHLKSEVRGKLDKGKTSFDALGSTFPAGTVSGAPKIRAMEIIKELEHEKRGPYAGAFGHIGFNGDIKVAITIRTMVVKDGFVYVQAGGGVVYDSDPKTEFEETKRKAAASLRAIDLAEKEEDQGEV